MMLKLFKRDETFVALLDKVIYFKAEGHYTEVYYGRDCKTLLPYGLSQMEQKLNETAGADNPFVKVGRSHIVNIRKVVYASIQKECITLLSNDSSFLTVRVPKNAIKNLIKDMKLQSEYNELGNSIVGGGEFS